MLGLFFTPLHAQPLVLLIFSPYQLSPLVIPHNTPQEFMPTFSSAIPISHTPRIAAFASSHSTSNHSKHCSYRIHIHFLVHSLSSTFFFSGISFTLFLSLYFYLAVSSCYLWLPPHRRCSLSLYILQRLLYSYVPQMSTLLMYQYFIVVCQQFTGINEKDESECFVLCRLSKRTGLWRFAVELRRVLRGSYIYGLCRTVFAS
jgi:hypothetical protein